MKILVTGISGRIGANLAKALIDAGHDVRGLVWANDRRSNKLAALDAELVDGSLVNAADVNRAMQDIEAVYHLGAAFQGGGPFSHTDYFEINVRGTFNMLEAAAAAPNLQHFFFASTDAIYSKYLPEGIAEPIHEDRMPILPGGMYALSKVLGEDLCRGYLHNQKLPITIFRFALAVAGDEILRFPQFYLPYWLKLYAQKESDAAMQCYEQLLAHESEPELLVLARDEAGRTYKKHIADVRDIVLGMLCGLNNARAIGETFQLAAPAPYTWAETIPYLAQKLDLDYIDMRFPDHNPTYYEFDLSKGADLLNYHPQWDIIKMIDSALAFRQGVAQDVLPV